MNFINAQSIIQCLVFHFNFQKYLNLVELQVLQMKYATGGHLGRDKTLEKISGRFYWRSNMTNDVKDFVTLCERCQRTNDKFTKPGSVLHPIPIEPEVWKHAGKFS